MVDFIKLLNETPEERADRRANVEKRHTDFLARSLAEKAAPRNKVVSLEGSLVEIGPWHADPEGDRWACLYVVPDSPFNGEEEYSHLRVMVFEQDYPQIVIALESGAIHTGGALWYGAIYGEAMERPDCMPKRLKH